MAEDREQHPVAVMGLDRGAGLLLESLQEAVGEEQGEEGLDQDGGQRGRSPSAPEEGPGHEGGAGREPDQPEPTRVGLVAAEELDHGDDPGLVHAAGVARQTPGRQRFARRQAQEGLGEGRGLDHEPGPAEGDQDGQGSGEEDQLARQDERRLQPAPGARFGASLGYLPELDDDMNSFEDLQVAAWYLWNADLGERTSWGLGYQKSWHHSKQDRDLLVAKLRVLPSEGWDFATTIWLDYYYGRDDGKGTTFGLTRALVSTSRRWQGGSGLEFHYDHEEYPELLRQELPQTLLPQTILDAHNDRLTGHAYWRTDGGSLWRLRATGWTDQDASGGTVEIGCEFDGLLQSAARTGLTLFEVQGLTSSVTGVRVDHGGDFSFGRLDMLYELGLVHHDDQPTDRDDMLQHRLGALCTSDLGGQWSGTFFADATLWDSEFSYGLGIYLQRRF